MLLYYQAFFYGHDSLVSDRLVSKRGQCLATQYGDLLQVSEKHDFLIKPKFRNNLIQQRPIAE